jgi:adenylate kinase family enzyme
MKVALIGSHGVGKTTLSFELAARLKRRNLDVDVVREVARRCPLPINLETTLSAQQWILHTQIVEEIEAAARHDIVVCDRSVLDNYCYLVHAAGSDAALDRLVDRWLPTYDLLVHVPVRGTPTYDGVRAIDPAFQEQIELLLEGMIAARGLRPLRLQADRTDDWVEQVVERMLPILEPTLPLFSSDPEDRDV